MDMEKEVRARIDAIPAPECIRCKHMLKCKHRKATKSGCINFCERREMGEQTKDILDTCSVSDAKKDAINDLRE